MDSANKTIAERMLAALEGDGETRLSLVRDENRLVWGAVLASPHTTPEDAGRVAAMTDVHPGVLTEIARNSLFVESYDVVRNLVENPNTPDDVAVRMLQRLTAEDIERVASSSAYRQSLQEGAQRILRIRASERRTTP